MERNGNGGDGANAEGGLAEDRPPIDRAMAWHLRKEWRYRERWWQRLLQVWTTDIFGILLPGVYFLVLFLALIVGITVVVVPGSGASLKRLAAMVFFHGTEGGAGTGLNLLGYLLVLIVSYMLGYVFYRRSPKAPDTRGFLRGYAQFSDLERCCWVESPFPDGADQPDVTPKDTDGGRGSQRLDASPNSQGKAPSRWQALRCLFGLLGGRHAPCEYCNYDCCELAKWPSGAAPRYFVDQLFYKLLFEALFLFRGPARCWRAEFPYRRLMRYLVARNMPDLAKMVPWKGQKSLNRSKHYINRIKEWVRCELPNEYDTVARNESHIRMVSSTWYATRTALVLSLIYALVGLGAAALGRASWWHVFAALGVMIVLGWFKAKIEGFIHYQRVREVVVILCMADYLRRQLDVTIWEESQRSERKKQEKVRQEAASLLEEIKDIDPSAVPDWLEELARSPSQLETDLEQ
jgi:hypothetical protein